MITRLHVGLLTTFAAAPAAQALAVPDLATVRGIEHFPGNHAQRSVLQRLGFVVIPRHHSAMHSLSTLPTFVTVDVAFHAVALQMRSMMQEIERALEPVLREFCERAAQLAIDASASDPAFVDVARFVALGRRAFGDDWEPPARVAAVLQVPENEGDPWAREAAIGVEPATPYADDDLVAYFRAWSWFTARSFDTRREAAARTALALHRLIAGDPALRQAYHLLRAPFLPWLGPTEMPDLGGMPQAPRRYGLLPPHALPCAAAMQRAADVRSGLPGPFDVLALGPLRCAPGRDLVERRSTAALARALGAAPLPDAAPSLYAAFLAAVASVHAPLPATAPPLFAQPAWQRRLCETQLGTWATVRETVSLHSPAMAWGLRDKPPPGRVAPYPQTFSAVADLARRLQQHLHGFDVQVPLAMSARTLVAALRREPTVPQEVAGELEMRLLCARELGCALPPGDKADSIRCLAAIAARQEGGQPLTAGDEDLVRTLASNRCIPRCGLSLVARTCDHFAAIAQRQLDGAPLSEDDMRLLGNVDETIREMHSPVGDLDRPIVTPVATDPAGVRALWLGTGYPAALYVVLDEAGTPCLFCGGTYTVRALVRQASDPALANAAWAKTLCSSPTTAIPEFGVYR